MCLMAASRGLSELVSAALALIQVKSNSVSSQWFVVGKIGLPPPPAS